MSNTPVPAGTATPSLHLQRTLATGLALGAALVPIRARIMGFRWADPSALVVVRRSLLAAYFDLRYVAVLTAAVVGLILLAGSRHRLRQGVTWLFLAGALFSLLAALVNVEIVAKLGRPLNYEWLYYSDFLQSLDARNAIAAALSWRLAAVAAAAVLGLLAAAWILGRALDALVARAGWRFAAPALGLSSLAYFGLAGPREADKGWDPFKLDNPVSSFARSLITARHRPALFTMATPVGSADFAPPATPARDRPDAPPRNAGIRNVILFVLESVPAEYLEPYGSTYQATPQLERYRSQSAIFTRIYAHAPATNYSLVALLLSTYPWISYQSLTEEHPDLRFPSLSSELKERGYRTTFLSSADTRFQRGDEFLAHRSFDRIQDFRSLHCRRAVLQASTPDWPFLDGADDECIVNNVIDWIGATPTDQPFFAMLWTMMTHYPYFSGGDSVKYAPGDSTLNRYLNALHHGDEVLGKLLRSLAARHLDRSTLVIVVGDHGEAFGRHGQYVHASKIYEENVHVPLILINPSLFHGERFTQVGGLIDVAPTILDLVGLTPPAEWQGRSLWSQDRSPRAYFFAPWSQYLFGFRENDRKVIYNASDHHVEVYDLAADPQETTNLAAQSPAEVTLGEERLAAWVQFQRHMVTGLLAKPAR